MDRPATEHFQRFPGTASESQLISIAHQPLFPVLDFLPVRGFGNLLNPNVLQCLCIVSQRREKCGIGVIQAAFVVHQEHQITRIVQDVSVPFFAATQFLLRQSDIRDVPSHQHKSGALPFLILKGGDRYQHLEDFLTGAPTRYFTCVIPLLAQILHDQLEILRIFQEIMALQLHGILRRHAEFNRCSVVELNDVAGGIERHDHVNRTFNYGTIEPLRSHQLLLCLSVLLDFFFE